MLAKEAALSVIAAHRTPGQIVVATMGAAMPWSRVSQSPWDVYSVDCAMGHAADFALGLAIARPDRTVVCLNGDGSMLMCLETLATAVEARASNFVLAILSNGTYEVTGNQPIPGAAVDFAAAARACGWPAAQRIDSQEALNRAWPELLRGGPALADIRIAPGREPPPNRRKPPAQDCVRVRTLLAFEDAPESPEFRGFDPDDFAARHRAELFPREG